MAVDEISKDNSYFIEGTFLQEDLDNICSIDNSSKNWLDWGEDRLF